jgi:hypothetical protein
MVTRGWLVVGHHPPNLTTADKAQPPPILQFVSSFVDQVEREIDSRKDRMKRMTKNVL